ncbi:serine hydrolase domain-containing protein [Plantactinospora sp. KLBMP9567]|uniref:serine hydrolase domain-containing protein n=1 Tax=Plantactinospora sp. KLBMP9567 TaxID=3085900 RepID=UPI0029815F5F|nr:serine hydrolase domain-containing protein [Plantactinospora sp. KLBMP9567]MDW5328187.1 serine hydrolase domain-containing protein [Plantactinospora sp. KLBMP9567]
MAALPPESGLLPETARRIDALVAQAQAAGRAPSLILGVLRAPAAAGPGPGGGLVHVATAGETPPPAPDVQYRIGSITKTMTAVLLLRKRDEGLLDLDDPLDRYLPGNPVGGVRLRQLLGHAAGLQREPDGEWWERSAGAGLDALLAGLTSDKLAFPAHRTFHYSNLAYGLLGAVLERVTGESWWKLVRSRLLDPLGMVRTSYQPAEPYARGYVVHPWHGTLREEPRTDTGAMAPAGQLWASLADLARWAGFLADPDPEILAPDTLAEMCVPVAMADLDAWTAGYGLGVELHRIGERVYTGHGGSMPGYVATLSVHRPSGTGVVGFANAYGLRAGSVPVLGRQVLSTVLDAEPLPVRPWRPATAPPAPEIAELTGRWWWMGREFEIAWEPNAEELVVTQLPVGAAPRWRFGRDATGRWQGRSGMNDGEILAVRRDPAGAATALDIATFVFTRDPDRLD